MDSSTSSESTCKNDKVASAPPSYDMGASNSSDLARRKHALVAPQLATLPLRNGKTYPVSTYPVVKKHRNLRLRLRRSNFAFLHWRFVTIACCVIAFALVWVGLVHRYARQSMNKTGNIGKLRAQNFDLRQGDSRTMVSLSDNNNNLELKSEVFQQLRQKVTMAKQETRESRMWQHALTAGVRDPREYLGFKEQPAVVDDPVYGQLTLTGSSILPDGTLALYPFAELADYIERDEALDFRPGSSGESSGGGARRLAVGGPMIKQQYSTQLTPNDSRLNRNNVNAASLLNKAQRDGRLVMRSYFTPRTEERSMAILTRRGYKGGPVTAQINQDRTCILAPFSVRRDVGTFVAPTSHNFFLGVFDGHGESGHVVSHYVVRELPRLLSVKLSEVKGTLNDEIVVRILTDTFVEVDHTVPTRVGSGCTASTIVRLGNKLYLANAGDSRTLVVRHDKARRSYDIVFTSRLDKPHLPEERRRIQSKGGVVQMPPPFVPGGTSRVLVMYGDPLSLTGLAMSRSIGDHEAEVFGVIPDPIIKVLDINELSLPNASGDPELFALAASDGLLDHLSIDKVIDRLVDALYGPDGDNMSVLDACEDLILEASTFWLKNSGQAYRDDISLAVTKVLM